MMLNKIGDNAVILVAAILTLCGIALALLPWGALSLASHVSWSKPAPAEQQFHAEPGEVPVGIPPGDDDRPAPPKPKAFS